MPVYNSGIYLKTAVESILNQSLKEIELILVDDGSTDGSSEQCDGYAKKDSRVVVIHQKNAGICNARNAALKIAKGEYIGFSDHDDEYLPGLLEDNYNICKENNLDFVKFCKRTNVFDGERCVKHSENYIKKAIYTRENVIPNIADLMQKRFGSCVWDTIFRRQFLSDNNIWFDPFFKMGGEDYAFIFKCFEHVERYGTNDKVYYYHIIRRNFSTSTKKDPNCMKVQQKFMVNFQHLLISYNLKPHDIQDVYTFIYTMFFLSPQIQNILRLYPKNKDRIELINLFRKDTFWYDFIDNVKISWSRSKVYYIIHLLFKHRMYRTLFFLYDHIKQK